MMGKVIDLTGRRFGRLIVVKNAERGKFKELRLICLCDCGNIKNVGRSHLLSGDIKSCGCLLMEFKKTHGMSKSRTYKTWEQMKIRCLNKNNHRYYDYGGRGIAVCDRWMTFENFYHDMGKRPKGKSIDRLDNCGNYEPDNCSWATPKEQLRNTRKNHMVTYRGATKCLAEWAEELEIKYSTLAKRLSRGHKVEVAFNMGNNHGH